MRAHTFFLSIEAHTNEAMSHENIISENPPSDENADNSIVCYCYKLTTRDLKKAYAKYGSLKAVEEHTRAGLGCTGCKILIQALFNEKATSLMEGYTPPVQGTSCSRPGSRTMKGFVIANGQLETTIYSSNAIAPQLGACDSTTVFNYALVDHAGLPVRLAAETVATNQTFTFDTKNYNLPRPFVGMFTLSLPRGNMGASRFNTYWSNSRNTTCTHEVGNSGRPRTFIPALITQSFLESGNTIYLALMNPHSRSLQLRVTVFEADSGQELIWTTTLGAYCSTWINASENFYRPALRKFPQGRCAIRVVTSSLQLSQAVSSYFFIHNERTDLWTSNHI